MKPGSSPAERARARMVVGLQPVRECLRARGAEVSQLALTAGDSPKLLALERFAAAQGARSIVRLSRGEMDRLAQGAQHQGAIALVPPLPLARWEEIATRPDLLAIALDRVQDPQNFGAVVRSAVATHASAILWGEHASAPLSPATFRASAGAIEHATLCRVPALKDALDLAREAGAQVIGLSAHGDELLCRLDLRAPTVIVLGSEGAGLQPAIRRACTHTAVLVRPRVVDSLNASVAAALALYEAAKQRDSL